MHESVLDSSILELGSASDLPKFIKELTTTVKNLSASGRYVGLDYQVYMVCHTNSWIPATDLMVSPESTARLNLQNITRFCYRLRMNTNDSSKPIDIEGVVPNGYARTPIKQVFSMRIKEGGIYQIGTQGSRGYSKLWRWLMDHARAPYSVTIESKYEELDGMQVIIHPPKAFPFRPPRPGQQAEGAMTLVLEEI
jgi:hypothetical protein